jgi:trigger factor
MKVNVEELSPTKKVMHVEIPEEDVAKHLEKAFKNLKASVNLRGFRPGKVPMSILERRFGRQVHLEVSGELIQDSYGKALGEADLRPVGEPSLDQPELAEKGQPYHYSATVEVCPVLEDLDVKGLDLEKRIHTVDDEEVDTHLKMLQKRSAQLKNVEEDRPVQDKDIVIIDYEGFLDGEPFEEAGKTDNFQVEIGSGQILPEFEEQLIGMKTGDTEDVEVPFPEDYYNPALAGKKVSFRVTLKEIKEEILPQLDDEFAKDLGEYETLDEVKAAIKEDLEKKYEAETQRQLREQVVDKLIEQSEFDLPEALVESELSRMVKDAQGMMAQRGITPDESEEGTKALSEKYHPLAERKVREYLLIEKVIEQEGIELTDEMLDKAYQDFADALHQPVDVIRRYHENSQEAREVFQQKALEKSAMDYIIANSNVQQVEMETEKDKGDA